MEITTIASFIALLAWSLFYYYHSTHKVPHFSGPHAAIPWNWLWWGEGFIFSSLSIYPLSLLPHSPKLLCRWWKTQVTDEVVSNTEPCWTETQQWPTICVWCRQDKSSHWNYSTEDLKCLLFFTKTNKNFLPNIYYISNEGLDRWNKLKLNSNKWVALCLEASVFNNGTTLALNKVGYLKELDLFDQ